MNRSQSQSRGWRLSALVAALILGATVSGHLSTRVWQERHDRLLSTSLLLRLEIARNRYAANHKPLIPAHLSDSKQFNAVVLPTSHALAGHHAQVVDVFLLEIGNRAWIAEVPVGPDSILRVWIDSRNHTELGWRQSIMMLIAGMLAGVFPLALLWRQARRQRTRISGLLATAQAAEQGRRHPADLEDDDPAFEEEIRRARAIGRENRLLRVRLAMMERRIQRLIEGLSEGLIVLDDQFRVVACNRMAVMLLGIESAADHGPFPTRSLRNRNLFNLVQDLEFLDELRLSISRSGSRRFRQAAPGYPTRHLEVRVGSVRLTPEFNSWLITLSDISERERAVELQRRFVTNASHEFKTPLTSIRGFAETLLDENPEGFHASFLRRIVANTVHLEEVVRDLLDLGALSERRRIQREPIDLIELARSVVERMEPQAMEKSIPISVRADVPGVVVIGDRVKLERALTNLLANAVKYCPDGTPVEVVVGRSDSQAVMEVRDRGPGIPPSSLPLVFERFYRVDPGRSRDTGGTGLGLALVREIARLHGGDAEADSEVGRGSTFRLLLPIDATNRVRDT